MEQMKDKNIPVTQDVIWSDDVGGTVTLNGKHLLILTWL